MKTVLLYKLADIINSHSKTYRAIVPCSKYEYMVQNGTRLIKSSCYVLRISYQGTEKPHAGKTVRNIYETDMDNIIKKVCRRDKNYAERVATCNLSPEDVDQLIRRASFKSLKLKIGKSSYYTYMGDDK